MTKKQLIALARKQLKAWGYEIQALPDTSAFCFEDDVLVGVADVYSTPRDIIDDWRPRQEAFFRQFVPKLRTVGPKSNNVIMVLLSIESGSEDALIAIEENFTSARKIARAGINGEEALLRALLPLGSIISVPTYDQIDPLEELRSRLDMPDNAFEALLDDDADRLIKLIEAHDP